MLAVVGSSYFLKLPLQLNVMAFIISCLFCLLMCIQLRTLVYRLKKTVTRIIKSCQDNIFGTFLKMWKCIKSHVHVWWCIGALLSWSFVSRSFLPRYEVVTMDGFALQCFSCKHSMWELCETVYDGKDTIHFTCLSSYMTLS